jgi:hypothetical protein
MAVFGTNCAASGYDMQIEILTSQLQKLESERAQKLDVLNKCEKEVKGFKIAGISTLALTGVGIYANIRLHKNLSGMSGGGRVGTGGYDTRSIAQITDDNIRALCEEFPDEPECKG